MFVIVKSDGSQGYTQVFGLYTTRGYAEADLPNDDPEGDYWYEICEVDSTPPL